MATNNPADVEAAKNAAGKAAADLVQPKMLVGLGTGSTSAYFIKHLIERDKKEHLHIAAVATSERSALQAGLGGIPIRDINEVTRIDFTADGADAIDPAKRIIKGGGGAHLREKIVAAMSDQWIVMIDPSKEVSDLGNTPLPVEISSFAYRSTINHIEQSGFEGRLRHEKNGSIYVTDNGNFIFDVSLKNAGKDFQAIDILLQRIPGVLDTGFFFDMATQVIIGYPDGRVQIKI